ncbi:hypothetical protein [Glycomyces salinus]|uniref:hypothetical protein n=1 Tax=Glycomyces salinus TaxID=980294 RepID=UPI0018EE2030|nr:hypothetical protein [Glycomyces salinus]
MPDSIAMDNSLEADGVLLDLGTLSWGFTARQAGFEPATVGLEVALQARNQAFYKTEL